MISFEPTVTLGAIAQTLVLLAGIVSWGVKINGDLTSVKSDIRSLQATSEGFGRSFEQLSKILTNVAVQDVRILNVEKDIDELRHHKGFINE